jgi:geranylgeranyl pyrophosphate synthase
MTKIKSLVDDFFKKIIKEVNAELNSRIKDPIIKSVLEGGKRLRPMLMLLTFCACNGGKENNGSYKRALEGAVSIELAHNASLVHDDIIDRDCKRRGKPALHVRNGVDAALLLGHKMIAAGFDIALNHGPDIAKVYVDTWNEALSGELMEVKMNNNGREEYSKENLLQMYYQIINQKTASLFASACMSGALEAKASWDVAKIFGEYGREIGMAYQLADDLVDLEKGERIDFVIKPLLK